MKLLVEQVAWVWVGQLTLVPALEAGCRSEGGCAIVMVWIGLLKLGLVRKAGFRLGGG